MAKSVKKNREAAPQPARQTFSAASTAQAGSETGQLGVRAGGDAVKKRALWLSAAVLIVSGYALLHKVDPGGQNAWSIVSPALLLSGYLLIIRAILLRYGD